MSGRLRVGVVGRRFGGDVHAPAFQADGRCEVVGVAGHDGWQALLESGVDALSIAVPPAAQTAIVIACARRGTHVFCEKPLADSLSGAEQAFEAVRSAGVVHAIDFQFPETPAWQQARVALREGAIGRVRHFAYTWRVETHASRMNLPGWKSTPAQGGGALGNFVSHVFFNIEWLLGSIEALDGFVFPDAPRTGRAVDGSVRLPDGVTGRISVSTDAFLGCGHVVEIFGDAGTIRVANAGRDYIAGFALEVGSRAADGFAPAAAASPAPGDGRIGVVAAIVRRFVDAVRGGAPVSPHLGHGLRVQQLLALAAAGGGGAQLVPARAQEGA